MLALRGCLGSIMTILVSVMALLAVSPMSCDFSGASRDTATQEKSARGAFFTKKTKCAGEVNLRATSVSKAPGSRPRRPKELGWVRPLYIPCFSFLLLCLSFLSWNSFSTT